MRARFRALLILVAFLALTLAGRPVSAQVKINVGSVYGPGAPVHVGLEKFKELVESRSSRRIQVLLHVGGAMGGERDVFEAMSSGALEAGAMGTGDVGFFFPKYQVFEVPYVMRDADHFWKFWNGPVGKEINDMVLRERGVMTTGVVFRGGRYLTANRPIRTPDQVKGLKLRLPEVKSWVKVWETLGALPVVVAFPEVYMALKTGVADAQENPPETIASYKFYEAQKYLIATRHIFSAARYQMSKKWFETLKPADQSLILAAWKDATDHANGLAADADKKFIIDLQAKGMTLVEPELEAFRKAVQPALTELNKTLWVPGLLERVQAIK